MLVLGHKQFKAITTLTGKVVSHEGDTDVEQVPEPASHDIVRRCRRDDLDELRLEELVAVEEDIVAEPTASSGEDTRTKVVESQFQGLEIVSSDVGLLLDSIELLACQRHLVPTVVDEPERPDGWDSEGDTVDPLGGHLGVRWVSASVVEDQQEDDQDDLVEELAPSLHQESGGDIAATVKTVLLGRDPPRSGGILHGRRGGHGVLSSNTNTIDEEGPGVANNPSVQRRTPRRDQHDQTQQHDHSILNETPTTSNTGRRLASRIWLGVGARSYPSPMIPTRIWPTMIPTTSR